MSHGLPKCIVRRATHHRCPMFFMCRPYPELCPTCRGGNHEARLQRHWRAPTRRRAIIRRRQRRRHTRLHIIHVNSPSPPASRRARSESHLIRSCCPDPPGALTLMQTPNSPMHASLTEKMSYSPCGNSTAGLVRYLATLRHSQAPRAEFSVELGALNHFHELSKRTARAIPNHDRQCICA